MKINSINLFTSINKNYTSSFKGHPADAPLKKIPKRKFETSYFIYVNNNANMTENALRSKKKAMEEMNLKLSSMDKNEISEDTRKLYADYIKNIKKCIIYNCITFNDYKTEEFSYDKAIEAFDDWLNYVEEDNDRLSKIMTTPYNIAKKEHVSIEAYAKNNPDDPKSEILTSKLYKMYKLTSLNKPSRKHFHE